jgi:hypothetical protein
VGRKLSPKENALYSAADEVLHYLWDPIGVSECPAARDEYHGYLPHVFSLLNSAASEDQIANYLGQVRTERMGLAPRPDYDKRIANLLIDWKNDISERFSEE